MPVLPRCSLALILVFCPHPARSQGILLRADSPEAASVIAARTYAGISPVQKAPVTVSRQVIAAVMADTLQPADAEPLRTALTAIYKAAKDRLTIKRFSGGTVQTAGPFRSSTQFQEALRELGEPASQPAQAPTMYSLAAGSAPQFGSDWPSLILIGRLPDLPPELREYAIAWMAAALRGVRATFLTLGEQKPAFTDAVARLTGGVAQFESAAELAISLQAPTSWIQVSWQAPAAARGFRYHRIQLLQQDNVLLMEVPSIATAPGIAAPDLDRFQDLRTRIVAARKLIEAGAPDRVPQAREELQQALTINPGDSEALSLAAELYKRLKDFKTAAGLLEMLAESEPGSAALAAEIGHAQFASGDLARADQALSRARELGHSSALLYEQLGRIRLSRNEHSGALSAFERSLQLDPKNQDLWFLQADTARKLGNPKRETEALELGIALGGAQVPRRAALIRIYLAQGQKDAARKQVEAALEALPADAPVQRTYAAFLEQLGRPEDALKLWRKAIELDPSDEEAHWSSGRLLLARKDLAGANAAADAGLRAAPHSGRLLVLKADTLSAAGDIGGARSVLRRGARTAQGTELLERTAYLEDLFGADGADLYASLSDALEKTRPRSAEHVQTLRRGLEVSIRDQNAARTAWFSSRLRGLGQPEPLVRIDRQETQSDVIPVLGGLDALAFIAHGKLKSPPGQFLMEYCRALIRNGEALHKKDSENYFQSIQDYFTRLGEVAGASRPKDGRIAITLSIADKNKRRETERILDLLGWKLHVSKEKVTVDAGQKAVQGKRQETSSALAIDEVAMQEALQAGKPFQFEIPYEWAPAVLGEKTWRAEFYPKENVPGGLAAALARDVRLARLYVGLATTDSKTASVLAGAMGLRTLAEKYSGLLYRYSAALAIEDGALIVPGGAAAEKVWAGLAGASPRDPAKFLRALLEKDDGRLLAFFSSLAQLDLPHQKFFTAAGARTKAFYDLFKESQDMARGAGKLLRDSPFTQTLREVPLDEDGRLSFPGSPEVWMVVRGSASAAATSKRIRKLSKVVAPEVEDEILLRLARKHYKQEQAQRSELDNFLAVVRIDAHRTEPLDEASALLLSENYARYPGLYPYFAVLTGLNRADFEGLFSWAEKLRGPGYDRLRDNMVLGQFHALMELICLARQAGQITEQQSTNLFRTLSTRFQKAGNPAEFVSASLDTVRALLETARAGSDPDAGLRDVLLGKPQPLEFELNGKTVHLALGEQRLAGYDRVLEMQKITRLAPLFRIESTCRQLATGEGPAAPLVKALDEQRGLLLHVELPKKMKIEGKQKGDLESDRPEVVSRLVAKLGEKAAKKKVNRKDIAKLATELLDAIEPQVRLALLGPVYAYFLRPDDLLVEDALLVRKHQFVSLAEGDFDLFAPSNLDGSSEDAGKFAVGGLAEFSRTAGQIATSGVRDLDPNSASVIAAQFTAVRMTDYRQLRDEDLRLAALRVRGGREWVLGAAADASLRQLLLEKTQGLLSLTRRRTLASALDARDWAGVWGAVTLGELYQLGRVLLEALPKDAKLGSPVLTALRQAAAANDGSRLDLLGGGFPESYGCSHPHLLSQAPYEEFEQYMMPTRVAERLAEFKLYLADAMSSQGVPAAAIGMLAEPVLRETVKQIHMADLRDWRSAVAALSNVNGRAVSEALDRQ